MFHSLSLVEKWQSDNEKNSKKLFYFQTFFSCVYFLDFGLEKNAFIRRFGKTFIKDFIFIADASIVHGLLHAYGAQAIILPAVVSKYQLSDWQLVSTWRQPPSVQQQPWLPEPEHIRQSN